MDRSLVTAFTKRDPHTHAGRPTGGDLDFALLHVARVREADVGDIVHDAHEHGAGKSVQIAAGNHSHGLVSQPWFLMGIVSAGRTRATGFE